MEGSSVSAQASFQISTASPVSEISDTKARENKKPVPNQNMFYCIRDARGGW